MSVNMRVVVRTLPDSSIIPDWRGHSERPFKFTQEINLSRQMRTNLVHASINPTVVSWGKQWVSRLYEIALLNVIWMGSLIPNSQDSTNRRPEMLPPSHVPAKTAPTTASIQSFSTDSSSKVSAPSLGHQSKNWFPTNSKIKPNIYNRDVLSSTA